MLAYRTRLWPCAVVAASLVASIHLSVAQAEIRPDDQQKIDAMDQSLHKAATLYRSKKFVDLGKLVEELETSLGQLKEASNEELAPTLAGLEMRVAAAQRLLKAGVDHAGMAKPTTPKPVTKGTPKPKTPTGGISFVRDVAPLLSDRCGNCHITQQKGGFSVATYALLRQGSPSGTVFNPGKGRGSTFIELLESGDMPRGGGGKLSDAEIDMLVKWIDAGAIFDGPDPSMSLASASGSAAEMSDAPTGGEHMSFMRDIAPILADHCTECHGGSQGSANFELDTFARLKKGGRMGDVLNPGKPNRSLLVQMLKGTAKDQMGKTRPQMPAKSKTKLPPEDIKKFETWIAEGAKYDGGDPDVEIDYLVKQLRASRMSHDELIAMRADLAKQNWTKGNPGVQLDKVEMEDFVVYGSMTPVRLKEIADKIGHERSKISNVLRLTPGKPIVKGNLSIFVFEKRFELTEFARMLVHRDLSSDTNAFFKFDVIDAYGGLLLPKEEDEATFSLLAAEVLCGLHVESLAKNVPQWFGIGAGRVFASKVEARSTMVKRWDEAAGAAMAGAKPNFVTAKNLDGQQVALSYGLVKSMHSNSTKFNALLDAMKKGAGFDQALMQTFGTNAEKLAQAWLR